MGATEFTTVATGKDMREAFDNAVKQAQYDYGHAGYTGTIAEKDGYFPVFTVPMEHDAAVAHAEKMMNDDHPDITDKWGPAGCIPIVGGKFLFFGWASC